MNSTHRVNVVKIDEILPHNGADTLGIVYIGGYLVDGAKHIREGIVVSTATEQQVRGLGRAQLKIKSMKFLEKENA